MRLWVLHRNKATKVCGSTQRGCESQFDPKATVRNVESGPSTFGLKGAEKGGEAGCWSVPLEAIVSSVHLLNYMNLLAVCFSESEALHEG